MRAGLDGLGLTPRQRAVLGLVLIAGCGLVACHVLWLPRILIDDAFISYRYARNLVAGEGLCFNPGERVEGYSNFLWVLLTALGMALRLDPIAWTRAWGAASLMGSLIVAAWLARRVTGTGRAALAVALILAASTAFCGSSMGGLETGLYALLVTACVACVAAGRFGVASVLMGLAAITRPEGAGLCPIAVVLAWRMGGRRRARGDLARLALPCVLMVCGLLAFRLWYFGAWLPNSVQAKSALPALLAAHAPADWPGLIFNRPGLRYAAGFLGYSFGPLVLLALVPAARGGERRFVAMFMAAAVCMGFGVSIANFGDWMSSYRLLIPYLPILCVLVIWGGVEAPHRVRRCGWRIPRPAAHLWLTALTLSSAAGQFQWRRPSVTPNGDAELAAVLSASRQPDLLAATDVLGRLGYYAPGVRILDMAGLTDAHIAAHGRPRPPFGRSDFGYVLARRPHLIMNNVRGAWDRHLGRREFVEGYWWVDRPAWTDAERFGGRPRCVFVRRGSRLAAEMRSKYPSARFRSPAELGASPLPGRDDQVAGRLGG